MFTFLKRFLGSKPVAPTAPTPYKVETPAEVVKAKKPAAKKAPAKPRKPKAPKA